MYLVEHSNAFIALVATSFGPYGHHPANAKQNFRNGRLHVAHKNVKLYRIPFYRVWQKEFPDLGEA